MNSIVASDDGERRSGTEVRRVQSPGCGMSASTAQQRFSVQDDLGLLHVKEFSQTNDCRYLTVILSLSSLMFRLFPLFAIRRGYG